MSRVRRFKTLFSSGFGSKVPSSELRRFSSVGRRGTVDFSPEPISGRPLRNERPFPPMNQRFQQNNQLSPHRHRSGKDRISDKFEKMRDFDLGGGDQEKENKFSESSASEFLAKERKMDDSSDNSFLEKFKLCSEKEKIGKTENAQLLEEKGNGDLVAWQECTDLKTIISGDRGGTRKAKSLMSSERNVEQQNENREGGEWHRSSALT